MAMYNHCTFIGRLGRDHEMSYTPQGKAVTKFSLAVDQGKDTPPMWLNIICWNDLAERVNEWLHKGAQVLVAGRLQLRSYTDRNKVEHTTAEIIAVTVQLLERKKETPESANADATDTAQEPIPRISFTNRSNLWGKSQQYLLFCPNMPLIQELDFRNPSPKSSSSYRFHSDSLGTSSPRCQMSLNVKRNGRESSSTARQETERAMTTGSQEPGGIRAKRIQADNVVSGVQFQGDDPAQAAALVQLAQAIKRGDITADDITARNIVSGLQYIANPATAKCFQVDHAA